MPMSETLLNENFIVQLREVLEADGSYTKQIFIGRLNEDGKPGAEPDEAILVQQQGISGVNSQTIEGIAECFFRFYMEEVEANSPAPMEEPDYPRIISATDIPTGPLPTGKIEV